MSLSNLSKGFILFCTLLFLQLFSLIGLYSLMAARLNLTNLIEHKQQADYQEKANSIMHELEKKLQNHIPLCFISVTSGVLLTNRKMEWWKEHGCHVKLAKNEYYYVVERLGKETCIQVINYDNYHDLIDFYRTTLLFLPNHLKKAKVILQKVIVKTNKARTSCSSIRHTVL